MKMKMNPKFQYTEEEAINAGLPVWKFRQLVEAEKIKIVASETIAGKPDIISYDGEDVERELDIFNEEMKSKRQ